MGGAFVAVADDASATWWNPAGLASGAYFNLLLEYDRSREPPEPSSQAFAFGFPALGLSYYRLPISQMQPATSTAPDGPSRQDQRHLSQFSATVGQSVSNHLVVASTLKLVRAGETHGDLDVGAMAAIGHVRIGAVLRNVRESSFAAEAGTDEEALILARQARAGIAFTARSPGIVNEVTIAADADLTKTMTVIGATRHVTAGAELWLWTRSLGIRGGLSKDTVVDRGSASAGLSLALRSGIYLEGQLTGGSDATRRSWGSGLRVTF
ncbi:MAG: hypothetical protein DMG00_06280 [Acidobacteria bacterium]|nr:MAG: hypothetical protein DMG00_06280 [Acidobacteriota bacterium]